MGHVITPHGLKPNDKLIAAVREFVPPKNAQELRRFLGLSSYYRRFVPNFAKIARPLHLLTCKGAEFRWTEECEAAFRSLKDKLTSTPVLAYPCFDEDFILKTDASIMGLGKSNISQLHEN